MRRSPKISIQIFSVSYCRWGEIYELFRFLLETKLPKKCLLLQFGDVASCREFMSCSCRALFSSVSRKSNWKATFRYQWLMCAHSFIAMYNQNLEPTASYWHITKKLQQYLPFWWKIWRILFVWVESWITLAWSSEVSLMNSVVQCNKKLPVVAKGVGVGF